MTRHSNIYPRIVKNTTSILKPTLLICWKTGTTVEIAAKVSESGKLFGGISNEAIAVALSDKAAVNPKAIEVETIKTTGDFPAKVALHPEITASFFVKVVAE